MVPRLKTLYKEQVVQSLVNKFSYKNKMEIPKLEKIIINMGLGKLSEAGRNTKLIDEAAEELASITGQKAVITNAKQSIAGFKLREGLPIGCKVTLRGVKMYEFLDRLVNLALPRVRDFRGISVKAFDGNGNYTLGLREHIIFPEIDYSKIQHNKGMNITFVTNAKTNEEAKELLSELGMPFVKTN